MQVFRQIFVFACALVFMLVGSVLVPTVGQAVEEKGKKVPVSKTLKCEKLSPVLLLLHGFGGNGAAMERMSGNLAPQARSRGWVVLTPTASDVSGRVWDVRPDSLDVKTLTSLVQNVPCRDTKRTYVAGHSMGAHMTSTMMCETRLFAAAAPVAGVMITPKCKGSNTLVAAFHGKLDTVVPISGPVPAYLHPWIPEWGQLNRYVALARIAASDGCVFRNGSVKTTMFYGQQVSNFGCNKFLMVNPVGGHEWPTYASQIIWETFLRTVKRGN